METECLPASMPRYMFIMMCGFLTGAKIFNSALDKEEAVDITTQTIGTKFVCTVNDLTYAITAYQQLSSLIKQMETESPETYIKITQLSTTPSPFNWEEMVFQNHEGRILALIRSE